MQDKNTGHIFLVSQLKNLPKNNIVNTITNRQRKEKILGRKYQDINIQLQRCYSHIHKKRELTNTLQLFSWIQSQNLHTQLFKDKKEKRPTKVKLFLKIAKRKLLRYIYENSGIKK